MSTKYIHKVLFIIPFFLLFACDSSIEDVEGTPLNPVPLRSLTADEVMTKTQKDGFKYFWDYANSTSKLALERVHFDGSGYDNNLIATGGSGFGLMNILVGINRGFVTRAEAVTRLQTALNWLENADRFHGAWAHWYKADTGTPVMIFAKDDGADIVETAFLCEGLICVREYFKSGNAAEQALATKADNLWKGVEWSWFTNGGNDLLWHWSPNYGFEINHHISGYNEAFILYVLAGSSPTYPISNTVYNQGWARNGGIANGGSKYGIPVVIDHNGASGSVGPMFFSHYSFMGIDPRGLTDPYVNYGDATRNHARIQHAYSVANPNQWAGYSAEVWGLTASESRNADGSIGYAAHSIDNDKGVITPTAAASNTPYTPEESIKFLKYCYEKNYENLIGVCGPYDAFSIHYNWYTQRYLAIDQGTIAPMIENYRSELLWELFMNAPDVRQGMINLGFHSTQYGF